MTDWNDVRAELELTTISGAEYVRRGRPNIGHWGKAYALGAQIGQPTSSGPAPPVGAVVGPPVFLRTEKDALTEKMHVLSSPDYGIGNMVWPPKVSTGRWTLRDCIAEKAIANPPLSGNGTKEVGFWIGQTTDGYRLHAQDNAWADDSSASELGQRLFFDPRFSGMLLDGDNDGSPATLGSKGDVGKVACAGCHLPESGFSDTRSIRHQISLAVGWGIRRAPSLLDVGQSTLLTWVGG